MEPALMPYRSENLRISSTLRTPFGKSHNTCSAIVGHAPVNKWTCPASLNFSSVVVAAAAWTNLPKRVPVFAKPQEGSSMRNWFRARMISSDLLEFMAGPQGDTKRVHRPWLGGHALSGHKRAFPNAEY